ncbi:YXWGXW repeat-containing protein [Vitiosangium sp. GDMCC 1.1324]|uniref:YXWGXW repeat-containing protein n=1 Tax=Vitiosangium sp. (strain GDMCC 1.1324) TaxID=2138576 RepID=UPI000D36E26B|nr:YXWGXW repeat-containing protein [Vitiosangium sp. GDMCC 1.1324]PTL85440.1 hypothetical protein DAT35_01595 [Vitiosangium sp. GDMCC 1.1324]
MTPRWLVGLVLGLASPVVHAQTAPVAAPDSEFSANADANDDANLEPTAPSPPPELPAETPTARPFSDAVWTSGHWYWDGNQWRFKPGAWIAKMAGYQFVNGYWQQDGNAWYWVSGGWARPGSTQVEIPVDLTNEEVTTAQAPPQLQAETPPPAPAPNLTWAPGYWYWSGAEWTWINGTWVAPPRPGLVFVTPRWVRRGPSWAFIDGGWAMPGSVRVVIPEYRHAGITVRWGHPNYFFHTWRRYPMVRPYYSWGRQYGGPHYYQSPHYGPRYHDAGPVHENHGGGHGGGNRGGRHHR